MYYPCSLCDLRFSKQYTEECDTTCDYAKAVKENEEMLEKIAIAIENECGNGGCPCKEGCNVHSTKECIDRIISWLRSKIKV